MKLIRILPNLLSVSRILLSVVMIPFWHTPIPLLGVFLACGATDLLDGWIARRFHAETRLGAVLDSLADFVFFWTLVAYFVVVQTDVLRAQLGWVAAVIAVRLLALAVCGIRNRTVYSLHTWANKLSGVLIFLCVCALLLIRIDSLLPFVFAFVLLAAIEELLIVATVRIPDPNRRRIFGGEPCNGMTSVSRKARSG
jgi:CDP-diacylglycerol---glycerol-3-phosphate 3-phosphatidyltransferase